MADTRRAHDDLVGLDHLPLFCRQRVCVHFLGIEDVLLKGITHLPELFSLLHRVGALTSPAPSIPSVSDGGLQEGWDHRAVAWLKERQGIGVGRREHMSMASWAEAYINLSSLIISLVVKLCGPGS